MTKVTDLSEARRALLDRYLRGNLPQAASAVSAIPRRSSTDPAPLSFGQQQLWLLAQLAPDTPAYNESVTLRLPGALDVPLLEKSLNEFINRHEAWRTIFPVLDEQPVQVVQPAMPLDLQVLDLSNLPESEREGEAIRLATGQAIPPFDLAHGPLLRALLVHLNENDHRLFMTLHHIIFDAVAINQIFLPELHALYEAFSHGEPSPLAPLPIQYTDFATWQRESQQKEDFAHELAYWKQQLAGAPQVLELPTDRPRPAVQSSRGSMQAFTLSRHLTDGLKALSSQEGVTLYMTLTTAFQTLLHRYTGQTDLVIGTVTSNRKRPEVQGLVGYFLNTLVLRTNMEGDPTFRELLGRVREVVISARRHEEVPFEFVVKELQPERSLSYTPLIQVIFSYQPSLPRLPAGWTCSQMDVQTYTTKFDLSVELDERADGLIGRFIYNTDLFEDATILRMIGHLETLLEGIVADPGEHIAKLPLMREDERRTMLIDWNATRISYPQDGCLHQLIEAQVERTPDAIALLCEHEQLTYRELNARANQLAHHLQQLGVGPEVMVGVCLERSLEMIVGLLAILKAGGVYVPLDPDYPRERLAFLLADSHMQVLLTQRRLLNRLPAQQTHPVCLDSDWQAISQQSETNPLSKVQAEQSAYVIYTSGSTGQPKGVLIPHQAIATHCRSIAQLYELRPYDRVLQFSNITFDASLEQILPTLLVGARLVVRGQEIWSPAVLLRHIKQQGLTVINLPPAYWQQALREWIKKPEQLQDHQLRLVIVGGDRLLPEMVQGWRQTPLRSARLLNAYGPTETTITATLYELPHDGEHELLEPSVPIGRPVPPRTIYILDRAGHPVPVGVPGEIHIGGPLLARGYLNRPALTAERFIADPFGSEPGARLYKTGDLARYRPDGTIEYMGRMDQQVKLRGFRIELGEIEEVLTRHPQVRDAVALAQEDGAGEKSLVAYIVATGKESLSSHELRHYLQQKLPAYMVPTVIVQLESLPLLSSGKVDRRALPAPEVVKRTEEETFVAPKLLIHQQLVQMWEELLDVRPIGIKDNFFYLGGHSLLAARLVDHIEHTFGKRIALSTLFSGPTIERLAEALQQQEQVGARTSLLPVQVGGSKRPLFFLHGDWTGGAFYCFSLARALGPDQPFYVLEPYKFGGLQTLPSFEEIAAAHIESMRTVQPEGPYLLAGFCNGGLLAYEMARQLEAAGEHVDFLALINPSIPVQFKTLRTLGSLISKSLRLGVKMQAILFLHMRHALRHIYRHLYPSSSRVQDFDQLLAIDPRLKAMFPPVEALHNDYVGAFTWLVSQYETGIYAGKITFYWAREEPGMENSWQPVTQAKKSEDIETHFVPGTHMSCVTDHIQDLAECLRLSMMRVQEETAGQVSHSGVLS